jgi:uncharacterized membrane protein
MRGTVLVLLIIGREKLSTHATVFMVVCGGRLRILIYLYVLHFSCGALLNVCLCDAR